MSKQISVKDASTYFFDGMTLMFGGFGGIGTPPTLVRALLEKGCHNLHLIGNDAGFPTIGIGPVICEGRARSLVASHIGSNPVAGELMKKGQLAVEFNPQGTLIERIRAGGAGIGGFFIDIGLGTVVEENKPTINLRGKQYIIELPLTADISIVYAKKADHYGNLVYDKSARNTNPLVAMAGAITIAEVEEIVPVGSLDPETIVTPGAFVDKIIQSEGVNWKWIWQ
ncbi:3-oxoacid CoA-transferase subunit A [Halalkalibacterium ligniniphilum]|uniref:3-oxoacid CoA-transferase subunit A n=1 Tax=Halalkalibacterium ligniniphilum TaxID=1134413 RepID=UPI00034DF2AA|nr:CoA transferase subunit A [Halalkalibacterium ligniniphilum]